MGVWFQEKMAPLCSSPPKPRQTIEFWTSFSKKQLKKAYKVLPYVVLTGGVWASCGTSNFPIWPSFAIVMALRSFCMRRLCKAAIFCRHIRILIWLKILKGHDEYSRDGSKQFCSFSKNCALYGPSTDHLAVPLEQRNGSKFCQNVKSCFFNTGAVPSIGSITDDALYHTQYFCWSSSIFFCATKKPSRKFPEVLTEHLLPHSTPGATAPDDWQV